VDGPNGVVGDSAITEVGGNVGIGTTAPGHRLTVSGGHIQLDNGRFFRSKDSAGLEINTFGLTGANAAQIVAGLGGDFLVAPNAGGQGIQFAVKSASGNVGIGTSTPTEKLHVADGHIRWNNSVLVNDAGGSIELGGTGAIAGSGTPYIDFHFNGLTQDHNVRLINFENNVLTVHGSTGGNSALRIGSNAVWQTNQSRRILFGDDDTTCGGPCVYIGEEDEDDRLVFRADTLFLFRVGNVIPSTNGFQNLGDSTHRWGTIFAANGTIQTSDARLKQAVTNLGYGLNQVLQLRPVSFQWKDRTDGRTYLGLLAQEVEKVIPEAIEKAKDPDAPLGLNYANLVPVMIKAVQEQQTVIERREADLKALKAENEALNARLAVLEQLMQQFKEHTEKQPQPKQQ
jgi:trimeric autotransporter adhesin